MLGQRVSYCTAPHASQTEEEEEEIHEKRTSFNMRTFPLKTPTCSSFWLSSSSSTAALYWPREFGVAALKCALGVPPPPFALGYALNAGAPVLFPFGARWSVDVLGGAKP